MTTSAPLLLSAEDLVAGYVPGVDILTGCTLELREGEIVGVIGPNGAGKSTLVKAIFGLVPIRSGRVAFVGDDMTNAKPHELVARGVGYVPQVAGVFPSLTIAENLEMGLYLRPKLWKQRFAAIGELFPLVHRRLKQRAGSLSGGERQMVAMARALMSDPRVLLLDEPSAGLSPTIQDEVFARVHEINAAGVSVIMVEQNARRCLELAHHGFVLDQGRDAYRGTGESLLTDPKVIDLYLGTLARAE
jgi:branched-chain amino acid transport system ATP-binding protein